MTLAVKVLQDGEASPKAQASEKVSARAPVARNIPEFLKGDDTVVDHRGRTYFLRKLKPSARLNLMIALGDLTSNAEVFGRASVVASISAMYDPDQPSDGAWDHTFGRFDNVRDLGITLDRLQDEGWATVFAGWRKMYGGDAETAEADQRDAAKN